MNPKQKYLPPPPVWKDFASIMLLAVPGAILLLIWGGTMWLLLKHPHSTSPNSSLTTQTTPSQIETPANSRSSQPQVSQTTPSQIGTPANPKSAQPQVPRLEDLKNLQSKVEELRNSNFILKTQLEELKAADTKVFDLVIAALGSLMAVAVIIPTANAISQALSNLDTRNKIQEEIRAELRKELDRQIGEIELDLLLKDYKISNLSINQTISRIDIKKIQDLAGISLDESWADFDIIKNKIISMDENKLRKLNIHRYPLVLQDISKALQAQEYLYSSDILPDNYLDILFEQQIKLFLYLLALMTYPNEDKDKYVLPRLSTTQLKEFKSTFKKLNEFFDENRSPTKSSKYIKLIREILSSNEIKQEFDFSRN
ncbi:MAG: hypothetical protein QNJ36_13650 [Calothrix sp. MO_167.B42]|nr:hypothetical protein [Calothrix sp. MO_167.B42]